jgi:hypothetical protein
MEQAVKPTFTQDLVDSKQLMEDVAFTASDVNEALGFVRIARAYSDMYSKDTAEHAYWRMVVLHTETVVSERFGD